LKRLLPTYSRRDEVEVATIQEGSTVAMAHADDGEPDGRERRQP